MQDLLFIVSLVLSAIIIVPLGSLLANTVAAALQTDPKHLANTRPIHDSDDTSVFSDVSGAGNEKLGAVIDHEGYF
jgi:hypothetical protein